MWPAGGFRNSCLLHVALAGLGFVCLEPCIASPRPGRNPAQSHPTSTNFEHSPPFALLRKLPATFEPNVGQSEAYVRYLSHTPGALVSLGAREIVVGLPGKAVNDESEKDGAVLSAHVQTPGLPSGTVALRFLGVNSRPKIEALDPLPTRTNYYLSLIHI